MNSHKIVTIAFSIGMMLTAMSGCLSATDSEDPIQPLSSRIGTSTMQHRYRNYRCVMESTKADYTTYPTHPRSTLAIQANGWR